MKGGMFLILNRKEYNLLNITPIHYIPKMFYIRTKLGEHYYRNGGTGDIVVRLLFFP